MLGVRSNNYPVNHQFNIVPLLFVQVQSLGFIQHQGFAVNPDTDKSGAAGRLQHVLVFPFLAAHLGGQNGNPAVLGEGQDGVNDLLHRLPLHRTAAFGAMGLAHPGKEQAQVVVNLGDGAHGGTRIVGHALLVNGDGGRKALNVVHVGLVHPAQELAGVGGEGFDVTPLPLGIDGVKGQRAFAGAGYAGDDHQLIPGDGYFYILEVMLAGTLNVDKILGHKATSSVD